MKNSRCIKTLTTSFVSLILLTIAPFKAISSSAEQASTKILAESLTNSERQVLEHFAAQLESYREQLNIPGMSAAVIKNQQLIWAQGFGFADVENKVKATPQTIYHLASLTKTFASQIIMKLVEEGKIDLEDPVRKYGVKIPDDPGIKVKHLLTHTSEGRPGSYYKYNGGRFGSLGKVVKKATGRTFRELVISQILEPADMNDTAPVLPRSKVKKFKEERVPKSMEDNFKRINKELAKPYALNASLEIVPNKYPTHFGVSTGLISNVIDMAKYDKAIDDNAFISKQTQELAWTATTSNSRKTLPYGLGWFVQHIGGTKLLWHYGWEISYSALILKVPEEDVTLVVFSNTDYLSRPFGLGFGDVLNSPFAVEFLKTIVFKDKFTEPAPQVDWQSKTEDIVSHFEQAKDADLKELLKRELISNLMLNHQMQRKEKTKKLMQIYKQVFTRDEFEDFENLPVIAAIDNVTDDQYKMVEFELTEDTAVRVYAIGEGTGNLMFDYGGIENAHTGQLVWEMYAIFTEHAGGASKNRKLDRVILLPAGTYRLHYRTDESHSFDNWNRLPPDHCWWGIRLFDVTASIDQATPGFWEKAQPEELGWSSEILEALKLELEKRGSAALMIVTEGKVVFEWGKTTNNIFSHSTRKSLLSALYGIYVADGKIDTSMTLEQLGIKEKITLTENEKQAKVIDLLKARSGVYIPAAAEVKSMRDARPKRGSHKPGTRWYYNNWDFNVLGTIFRQQTGEDIYEAFKKRIADPIGMQDFILEKQQYSYEENFSIHPAYPFLISARDMARLGQLFLQQGKWNGEQIIPSDWVKDSTRSYSNTNNPATGYGFMWWIITDDFYGMKAGDYFASGYGGQKIFVLPRINTVVVHRINIYVPGIDIRAASGAPFQLMPKILEAYTAQKKQAPPVVARTIMPPKHLLIDYATVQPVKQKDYTKFRIALWLCVAVFGSAILIWPLLFFIRRLIKVQASTKLRKRSKISAAAKFLVCLSCLFCIILLLGVLLIPEALEFIAVNGLPPSLPLYWKIISYTPWLCIVVMAPILILNITAWIKKYWTIFERLHFGLVSITLIIFIWLSFTLNMVPGLP
ncbi:MAG: serine hydrolase [Phycisphaerae bacterium]|nr:serine hydrolase [Phycisphaerae bacterium]NIS53434.1 serine hydrolase [Phycisphaerae bacterium]NIU12101.1 serine hydrolase [Phycisphaerae bacterium]